MKLIARGVLLLPFLLLLAFVACTPADSPSDDAPDLPPAGSVMLSDLSSYTIVRADGLGLSAKNQVFQLKKHFYEFSGTDPQSLVCTDSDEADYWYEEFQNDAFRIENARGIYGEG